MPMFKKRWYSSVLLGVLGAVAVGGSAHAADTTPPSPFDLAGPTNGAWCTATCRFDWATATDDVGIAKYQLWVDGVLKKDAIAAFPSEYTLAMDEALTAGLHTWYVVAFDAANNSRTSTSTWSIKVDATPPAAFSPLTPLDNEWLSAASPLFSWSASSDADSGLAGYEIWIMGALAKGSIPPAMTSSSVALPTTRYFWSDAFSSGCPGWTLSSSSWSCGGGILNFAGGYFVGSQSGTATQTVTVDLTNAGRTDVRLYHEIYKYAGGDMSEGSHDVLASDDSGTSWRLVNAFPQVTKQEYVWATIPFDDFTGRIGSKIRFDSWVPGGWNGWGIDWVEIRGVSGGPYSWYVVAVDVAGNRTTTATWTLEYDVPPAPFDLVSPPTYSPTADSTPTFVWTGTSDSGSGLAKYQIWIDDVLALDSIAPSVTTADAPTPLTDSWHSWQVYALDAAGALRKSRTSRTVHVDTTPPAAFSLSMPADGSVTGLPTPSLCWSAATDAGSGLDTYELWIDGGMNRSAIPSTTTCATPMSALSEGPHMWFIKAADKVGNVASSTETWTIYVDFGPPAAFSLVAPSDGASVYTSTPTFEWMASSDAGSGIDHYELYVDGACTDCSIAGTTTMYILPMSIVTGTHTWYVKAVDKGGAATTATSSPWSFTSYDCMTGAMETCAGSSVGECKPGTRTCSGGAWGTCMGVVGPATEICDSKDNNCDGATDDGFDVGIMCMVGVGECLRIGMMVCKADGTGTQCSAMAGTPSTEICGDLKDNNCDGMTDEGCEPDAGTGGTGGGAGGSAGSGGTGGSPTDAAGDVPVDGPGGTGGGAGGAAGGGGTGGTGGTGGGGSVTDAPADTSTGGTGGGGTGGGGGAVDAPLEGGGGAGGSAGSGGGDAAGDAGGADGAVDKSSTDASPDGMPQADSGQPPDAGMKPSDGGADGTGQGGEKTGCSCDLVGGGSDAPRPFMLLVTAAIGISGLRVRRRIKCRARGIWL